MKKIGFKIILLVLAVWYCLSLSDASAATVSPALQKAKQSAEARGYTFAVSHDEVLAMAKKEGKLVALCSMDPDTLHPMRDAFKAEYPFLNVTVEESTGTEVNKRTLMELKAGRAPEYDAIHFSEESYQDFAPFLKKIDMLGMAEQGVLIISPRLIEPNNRNAFAGTCRMQVVAYNKKLVSPDSIPNTLEGFLKPEFKGRKFIVDIRPFDMASLVPAWGLEKTVSFSRSLAAQQPIWVRGFSRMLVSMAAGEYTLAIGTNLHSFLRFQAKDPQGNLAFKVLEPVPTRLSETTGILATAQHPYAALLWLEFMTSPKGQQIRDKYDPCGGSIFSTGSCLEQLTRGKKVSFAGWEHLSKIEDYMRKVLEAYGFPTADRQ
jgi:hypothetical protein